MLFLGVSAGVSEIMPVWMRERPSEKMCVRESKGCEIDLRHGIAERYESRKIDAGSSDCNSGFKTHLPRYKNHPPLHNTHTTILTSSSLLHALHGLSTRKHTKNHNTRHNISSDTHALSWIAAGEVVPLYSYPACYCDGAVRTHVWWQSKQCHFDRSKASSPPHQYMTTTPPRQPEPW